MIEAGQRPDTMARFETILVCQDGTQISVEVSTSQIISKGKIMVLYIVRDITARKQAEQALRDSEERIRQMITSISDHVYMSEITEDGRRVNRYLSPHVESLTGYPLERFMADRDFWPSRVIHPDDQAAAAVQARQLAGGQASEMEYRLVRADGKVIWVRDSARAERKGDSTFIYGVVSDITERKQLEEQLYQSQKMEAIGRLAGGIAHDFNNLLTVINGYGELLLHRHLTVGPTRNLVEQIMEAGRRAADLTRQLLAFSRKETLKSEVLDLNDLIEKTEKILGRLIGEDIELLTILEPSLGQIKADQGQIDQVIMNLAVNARDAMPQGGRLTIKTTNVELDKDYTRRHVGLKPGSYVLLSMSDTGHGMDVDTQTRIFEPFFTTKEKGQGTGLGLATVHSIVTRSGGHIQVKSSVGQGTAFEIYLPRLTEGVSSSNEPESVTESARGSETILLVEDEDIVRKLTEEILLEEGYSVLAAHNGKEALRICERYTNRIDLILTDIVMPGGISGYELAEKVKLLRPAISVLYFSGYTEETVIQRIGIELESSFLAKPFTPNELARKVREKLDTYPGPSSGQIQARP